MLSSLLLATALAQDPTPAAPPPRAPASNQPSDGLISAGRSMFFTGLGVGLIGGGVAIAAFADQPNNDGMGNYYVGTGAIASVAVGGVGMVLGQALWGGGLAARHHGAQVWVAPAPHGLVVAGRF